jgi:hypothetical protein
VNEKKIKVGDLVRILRNSSYYRSDKIENKEVTGIVVEITDERESVDYWIRVVFLDNSKATLFHDEVEVISTQKDKK